MDAVLYMENCSEKVVLVFITYTVFRVYCAQLKIIYILEAIRSVMTLAEAKMSTADQKLNTTESGARC